MQVQGKILKSPCLFQIDLFCSTDSSMNAVNFIGRGTINATQKYTLSYPLTSKIDIKKIKSKSVKNKEFYLSFQKLYSNLKNKLFLKIYFGNDEINLQAREFKAPYDQNKMSLYDLLSG